LRQGSAVAAEDGEQLRLQSVGHFTVIEELNQRDDQRRLGYEPGLSVDLAGQLRQRASAILCPRLRGGAAEGPGEFPVVLSPQFLDHRPCVESRIPNLEVTHGRELPHCPAVGAQGAQHDPHALGVAEVPLASCDLEACGETLHIPFEWARARLVEVVEVEDEITLGGGKGAEVQQVRVPRELHPRAGSGRAGQVVRHHGGRAAEDRER
jgi:hypothetical protein